ncbi:MAG: hypothetical protein JWO45_1421 [Spartobacteria bacterium]|nr:hypothetical protein [Spartobacteria bacterium]
MYGRTTKTMIGSLATALVALSESTWAAGETASFATRHHGRQTHHAATLPGQAVSGVIPRAIRGGNPLQMLNPFAPAKHGTAEENVSLDPEVPGNGNRINLFSISF